MKTILMTLYGPLETDARVLRSIDAALQSDFKVRILTCGTQNDYVSSDDVEVINLPIKAVGIKAYWLFCRKCLDYYRNHHNEIDVVYLHDYYSTFVGLLFPSYSNNQIFIYDAHELILPMPKQNLTLRERFFVYAEKRILRKVNLIIQANKEREQIFKGKYPFAKTSNVLNITKYSIEEGRTIDNNKVVLVYQGNISEDRHLSFFIDAIAKMEDKYSLLMIGSGPNLNDYRRKVEEMCLGNRVTFTGRLSNVDMMTKLKSCSIGIISYPFTNYNNIYCSPNKIFEYAAMSLPFIATEQPFIREVQDNYGIGRTFKEGNIQSFIDNIQIIVDNYTSYTNTGLFLKEYSYEKELEKLKGLLTSAI